MDIGRPNIFKKEYTKLLQEYFDIEANVFKEVVTTGKNEYEKIELKEFANNLPTIQGFCRKINQHRSTVYNWLEIAEKGKEHKDENGKITIVYDKDLVDFSDTFKKCKDIQEQIWIENSLKGLYNPAFTIFYGKNVFGYTDKSEVENTIKIGENNSVDKLNNILGSD